VCGWQVKPCDPFFLTHGLYLSALEIKDLQINSSVYFYFTFKRFIIPAQIFQLQLYILLTQLLLPCSHSALNNRCAMF